MRSSIRYHGHSCPLHKKTDRNVCGTLENEPAIGLFEKVTASTREGGARLMALTLDFCEFVLRVISRPSRAPTAAEVSKLPAKCAKNANDRKMCLPYFVRPLMSTSPFVADLARDWKILCNIIQSLATSAT